MLAGFAAVRNLLPVLCLLVACSEVRPHAEISRGRPMEYLQEFESKSSIDTADVDAAFAYCRAYYELRYHDRFMACADKFLARFGDATAPSLGQLRTRGKGDFVSPMLTYRAAMRIDLQEYEAAASDAGEAVTILDGETMHGVGDVRFRAYVEAIGSAGLAHALLGQKDKALAFATKLDNVRGGMTDDFIAKPRNTGVAKIYAALGDDRTAIQVLERYDDKGAFYKGVDAINRINPAWYILQPFMTGSLDPDAILTDVRLKKEYWLYSLYARNGRKDEAAAGFDKLLADPALPGFAEIYWPTLYQRSLLFRESGNMAAVIEHLERAVAAIESQRATIPAEGAKIGFAADKQAVYAVLIEALHRRGDMAQAFSYAERAKARALVDMLASRRKFAARERDPSEVARLVAEVEQMERASLAQVADAQGRAGVTRGAVDGARGKLRTAAPELASLVSVDTASAAEIQGLLAPDEILLLYYGSDDDLFVFRVSRNAIKTHRIETKGLESLVRRFRENVQQPGSQAYMADAQALYSRLVAPVGDDLVQKTVTVVPHGPLHYMPFVALHDGNGFLIERGPVRMLPSASVLRYLKAGGTKPAEELLALGNPELNEPSLALEGAEAEARAIAQSWPRARVLLRGQATETIVKKVGGQFRYLHFASHGEFDATRPLASRLLLAADGENDGNLTADELYDLRLNAELVTLSACNTGMGEVASGDDVIGLTRGFLYAGTRAVVASLWPVADAETTFLMTAFYSNLRTMPKAEALRQAQLATKAKYAHPVFWAAFQLTGETN